MGRHPKSGIESQAGKLPRDKVHAYQWVQLYFWIATLGLAFSPAGSLMKLGFPVLACTFAALAYRRSKSAYVFFLCWLWFLCPFMRRVIEAKGGSAALVLAVPYLACLVPLPGLILKWRFLLTRRFTPFLCMLAAIFYGTIIGLMNFPAQEVAQGLVLWCPPLVFGCFLLLYREEAEALFASFTAAMIGGTAVAGFYGIAQYFFLPSWDAGWMRSLGNVTFGNPQPLQVRVFSTLNAPQILALFVSVGILLAIRSLLLLRFIAIPAGLVVAALSMARTAWIGFFLALMFLFAAMKLREKVSLLLLAFISGLVFFVALQDPRVSETLNKRFDTLSNINHDASVVTRLEGHLALLVSIKDHPFGLGIGGQETGIGKSSGDASLAHGGAFILQNDSTLAALIISLGPFGCLLAITALVIPGLMLCGRRAKNVPDKRLLQAMLVILVAEFLLDNVINGPAGFLTWSILGFGLSLAEEKSRVRRHAVVLGSLSAVTV